MFDWMLMWVVGIASAYLLWALFVVLFVSSLNEIKEDSWHFKLYCWFCYQYPNSSCDYAGNLVVLPLVVSIFGVLVFVCTAVEVVVAFFDWVVIPFFIGKIPGYNFRTYADIIKEGDLDFLRYRKPFMRFSPFIYLLVAFIGIAYVWEIYRFANGIPTPIEAFVFSSILILFVLIAGVVWTVKRPKTKEAWASLKGHLCRKLEVVG